MASEVLIGAQDGCPSVHSQVLRTIHVSSSRRFPRSSNKNPYFVFYYRQVKWCGSLWLENRSIMCLQLRIIGFQHNLLTLDVVTYMDT
ncbi:hypothetical protein AZE42_13721 [Rhizopogon vesiculosus]|uniref:Uncharacterized protein n=1 Tax=Rhizopogon vesiculosus TaxID=180088 RepID=A0A1J8R7I2_9AGAM|nr:hypothetical protein AZE42_13721 [Rhizopogon vesiculosus]